MAFASPLVVQAPYFIKPYATARHPLWVIWLSVAGQMRLSFRARRTASPR
jgi:hypothetical protein